MNPLAALFWSSLAVLLYVYLGYPALCWLRARMQPRPFRTHAAYRPLVSLLVAAYNEENEIARRIANIAAQDALFPFEVLVGSDGSTDSTFAVATVAASEAAAHGAQVRVFEFPRRGKIATLVDLIEKARGEVLVFTDANSQFPSGTLEAIVAPLADPAIACACGGVFITSGHQQTAGGERLYRNFENRLKQWESAFGSCAGADGALYALRRADLPPLITNRLLADDFYISLSVCSKGRCVLAPGAAVVENSDTTARNELRRKARILAGALAGLAQRWKLLLPGSGMSLALWSHKMLRWFAFIPLCGMIVGAMGLSPAAARTFYFAVVAAAIGVLAGVLFPAALRTKIIKVPYYFALMNLGQVLGLLEWIRHGNQPAWEKTR